MSFHLAEAAKRLGSDTVIMESYWKYHEREQNWFFSPNMNLDNATKRPYSFPTPEAWAKLKSKERKDKWENYSLRQRMTISTLAGFGYHGTGINLDNSHHFARLREGYNKWRSDLYSVFWSNDGSGRQWLCNVFVGDAIYLCTRRSFTAGNQHYFDPRQIHAGQSFLRRRRDTKDIQVGDIVVFGINHHHVEIIVELKKNYWLADDGFCSIGAGRGFAPDDSFHVGDGKPKCDSSFTPAEDRELGNKENSYFYL